MSNFYHFDAEQPLHPQLHYKLNALLPHPVSVKRMFKCVGEPINARFDAHSRSYRYKIYKRKNPFYYRRALFYPYSLNEETLHETAEA